MENGISLEEMTKRVDEARKDTLGSLSPSAFPRESSGSTAEEGSSITDEMHIEGYSEANVVLWLNLASRRFPMACYREDTENAVDILDQFARDAGSTTYLERVAARGKRRRGGVVSLSNPKPVISVECGGITIGDFLHRDLDVQSMLRYIAAVPKGEQSVSDTISTVVPNLLASSIEDVDMSETSLTHAKFLFRNIQRFRDYFFSSFEEGDADQLIMALGGFSRADLSFFGRSLGRWFSHDYSPAFSYLLDAIYVSRFQGVASELKILYSYVQRGLLNKVSLAPLQEFVEKTGVCQPDDSEEITKSARLLIGNDYDQASPDIIRWLGQRKWIRIKAGNSLFFRRFGINKLEIFQEDGELNAIAVNTFLNNGLCLHIDVPASSEDKEISSRNMKRNNVPRHISDQVVLGIQALLLDLHRFGRQSSRFRETTAVARYLMTGAGFEDPLQIEEQHVRCTPRSVLTHREKFRLIYTAGIEGVFDMVDPVTGEVCEYIGRQAFSYKPLRVDADDISDAVLQINKLGIAAFVDELDPYYDWEKLFKSIGRISWMAAIELYLLNRL